MILWIFLNTKYPNADIKNPMLWASISIVEVLIEVYFFMKVTGFWDWLGA